MMKSPFFWFGLVGLIALVDFVAFGYLIVRSSSDQTFSVEENYYEKGLDWDARMAQDRMNDELGWRVDVRLSVDDTDRREVVVRVWDRDGDTITGARVRGEMFAILRGNERFEIEGVTGGEGSLRLDVPSDTAGYWEARVRVEDSRGRVYTHTGTFMVAKREWDRR